MPVDDFIHGLLDPGEGCVWYDVHTTYEAKVPTYGERLPSAAHHVSTKGALDHLPLVINGKAVTAEDGPQLPPDVGVVSQ